MNTYSYSDLVRLVDEYRYNSGGTHNVEEVTSMLNGRGYMCHLYEVEDVFWYLDEREK